MNVLFDYLKKLGRKGLDIHTEECYNEVVRGRCGSHQEILLESILCGSSYSCPLQLYTQDYKTLCEYDKVDVKFVRREK